LRRPARFHAGRRGGGFDAGGALRRPRAPVPSPASKRRSNRSAARHTSGRRYSRRPAHRDRERGRPVSHCAAAKCWAIPTMRRRSRRRLAATGAPLAGTR
jgi:hypothetical protein